ncbi:MAG TPA: hypothetical protein VHZ51_04865 [Ktedonobacteraceae bacterium]|jgi:signal transduction histidine kinase|nr:hypothetical protein [Ktedonobacteraceae bacterium]
MVEIERNALISEDLVDHSLIEIIQHEVGNGLTIISGYAQFLQRELDKQAQAASPPELDVWKRHNERWLSYVQTIRQRETQLHEFLTQLCELSSHMAKKEFSKCFVQTDFVLLLKRTIERLALLYEGHTIQVYLPDQPIYIRCDLLWMELVVEHVIAHTIVFYARSAPVDIRLERYKDPFTPLHNARLEVRVCRGPIKQTLETVGPHEAWLQAVSKEEEDLCVALCDEIMREHGGRIWHEQDADQREIVYVSLPLIE